MYALLSFRLVNDAIISFLVYLKTQIKPLIFKEPVLRVLNLIAQSNLQ